MVKLASRIVVGETIVLDVDGIIVTDRRHEVADDAFDVTSVTSCEPTEEAGSPQLVGCLGADRQ